jgi:class 3 adenylate cyclase
MTQKLKDQLSGATGDSRFVVVVFLDIRGFSSFAKLAESSESAVFLKSAYTSIMDDYFGDASFFKPTGDGLLVILDYEEENLEEVVQMAVETSVRLVEAFPTICAEDPMVNFEVPGKLGIGVARGAATRLRSDGEVLDYSGRPLNLAARLMDMARPSGVIFSDALGLGLLNDPLLKRFQAEQVYVRGVAEDEPMSIHYLSERTVIEDVYKRPMHRTHVHAEPAQAVTVREMEQMGSFRFHLSEEPIDRSKIKLVAHFPDATRSGKKSKGGLLSVTRVPAVYAEDAEGPHVRVPMGEVARRVKAKGARSTWSGKIKIEYIVAGE